MHHKLQGAVDMVADGEQEGSSDLLTFLQHKGSSCG